MRALILVTLLRQSNLVGRGHTPILDQTAALRSARKSEDRTDQNNQGTRIIREHVTRLDDCAGRALGVMVMPSIGIRLKTALAVHQASLMKRTLRESTVPKKVSRALENEFRVIRATAFPQTVAPSLSLLLRLTSTAFFDEALKFYAGAGADLPGVRMAYVKARWDGRQTPIVVPWRDHDVPARMTELVEKAA
ncbi:hypothetical protein MMC08_003943 [Hypocenomyce scalaris]|nr:hypothetical protein [Hypocenomyce scalaris]